MSYMDWEIESMAESHKRLRDELTRLEAAIRDACDKFEAGQDDDVIYRGLMEALDA